MRTGQRRTDRSSLPGAGPSPWPNRPNAPTILFFALDGTLTDSSPGILRCIDHALESLGHAPARADRIMGMIGAPLPTIFQTLLGSDDEALVDQAVAAYRSRFNTV